MPQVDTKCLVKSLLKNKVSIGLDIAGAAVAILVPEESAGAAILGSGLGVVGIANAIHHKDLPGGAIAFSAKEGAVATTMLAATKYGAIASRLNAITLISSIAYDSYSVYKAYNECLGK